MRLPEVSGRVTEHHQCPGGDLGIRRGDELMPSAGTVRGRRLVGGAVECPGDELWNQRRIGLDERDVVEAVVRPVVDCHGS